MTRKDWAQQVVMVNKLRWTQVGSAEYTIRIDWYTDNAILMVRTLNRKHGFRVVIHESYVDGDMRDEFEEYVAKWIAFFKDNATDYPIGEDRVFPTA